MPVASNPAQPCISVSVHIDASLYLSQHVLFWFFLFTFCLLSSVRDRGDFFFNNVVCLFVYIYGCIGSLLLRAGFLQLPQAGATLHCGARTSHYSGFSCCGARALGAQASVVVARGLQSAGSVVVAHGLSCSTAGMWDLPGPGFEPVSPALAGGFLTTAPPGKPRTGDF